MKKLTKEKLRRYKLVCIFSYSKFAFSYKIVPFLNYMITFRISNYVHKKIMLHFILTLASWNFFIIYFVISYYFVITRCDITEQSCQPHKTISIGNNAILIWTKFEKYFIVKFFTVPLGSFTQSRISKKKVIILIKLQYYVSYLKYTGCWL